MGGSSGGGSSSKKAATTTTANVMPQMATFGQNGITPGVTQQLAAGGLLSTASPNGFYDEFQVPILRTPSDIDAYLRSIGKTPVTAANVDNLKTVGGAGTPKRPVTPATPGGSGGPSGGGGGSPTPRPARRTPSLPPWLDNMNRK